MSSTTGSSSVFCSSSSNIPTVDDIGSYKVSATASTASSERINPFDKNNKPTEQRVDSFISTATVESTNSTNPLTKAPDDSLSFDKYQSSAPAIDVGTDKKIYSYASSDSTEKYTIPNKTSATTDIYGSKTDITSTNISSTAVPESATSKRSDASKYSFGTNQYTRSSGSFSDADIIFGGGFEGASSAPSAPIAIDKSRGGYTSGRKYGREGSNFNTSIDSSDSIFGTTENKRDLYNTARSMSVSSAKDADYIYQTSETATTTAATYRVYEGIQNAAFQDFDSPSRSSVSSVTSAGSTNKTRPRDLDDDYDLK